MRLPMTLRKEITEKGKIKNDDGHSISVQL